MLFDKSIPNWPAEAVEVLATVQNETLKGCGGCVHAEWVAARDASTPLGKVQQSITFGLGACRADIRLGVGTNGLRPVVYCTAWNQPTAEGHGLPVDPSNSTSVGSAVHRVGPPVTSPSGFRVFHTI